MQNWGSTGRPGLVGGGLSRRAALAGLLAAGAFALPGCTTMMRRDGTTDIVRRMLELSTQRAFARLVQPDGFWDSSVARINLPVLFGKPGSAMAGILRSEVFREKLQHHLNNLAEDGARKAAPVVAEAVRSISIPDTLALLHGERTAATTYLRQAMGPALVNAMIPALDEVMRVGSDPVLGQAIAALSGVDLAAAAHALAIEADNAIWYEIGASEADIRADPASSNDPLLIAGLKAL